MKKQILLTALTLTLLASAVMTTAAEEVVGRILAPPDISIENRGPFAGYSLGTKSDFIEDMYMQVFVDNLNARGDMTVYATLSRHLKEGRQVVIENDGLKPNTAIGIERLIAIIIDGRRVGMDEIFPANVVARDFPYYHKKYVLGQGATSR